MSIGANSSLAQLVSSACERMRVNIFGNFYCLDILGVHAIRNGIREVAWWVLAKKHFQRLLWVEGLALSHSEV